MSSISPEKERLIVQTVHSVLDEFSSRCPTAPVRLTLEDARTMACAASEEATRLGVPVVISVVDESGRPVILHRMDDSLLVSLRLAEDKAYTAVALQRPTHELVDACRPGQDLYGLNHQERIVIMGGGVPCWRNGRLAGAVGISGGTVEQDVKIALFAIESLLKGARS